MSTKDKLLMLWVLVIVFAALAMTHFGSCLAFVVENCFAAVFPVFRF